MVAEVVIVGAGPAGMAAALQLKRSGIEPLLLEGERVGGLLLNANLVENYPGFPQGLSGEELIQLFEEHLKSVGIEVHFEQVRSLDHDGKAFMVETDKREFSSRVVVLASGTKPKEFTDCKIPEEARDKIFYEIYPLRKTQGRRIAIVGAGDAALDYALNLSRKNEVLLLNRGERVESLPLLWERAKGTKGIDYREKIVLSGVDSDDERILLHLATSRGRFTLEVDHLVFAIGRVAQLDYLSGRLQKEIERLQAEGLLYFVGDVRRGLYRQTAIAVGDGIEAAMKIYQRWKEAKR